MLPDRVSNPGPLTYESGALLIAPRGPAEAHYNTEASLILLHLERPKLYTILAFLSAIGLNTTGLVHLNVCACIATKSLLKQMQN